MTTVWVMLGNAFYLAQWMGARWRLCRWARFSGNGAHGGCT